MVEQIVVAVVTGAAGGAAAWATLQGRVGRLEEVTSELKADKASKESVDAVKQSIASLRDEMDRRFDRIEALLSTLLGKGKV